MKTYIRVILTASFLFVLILPGCNNIPESSPMSKIKCGMSRGEVIDILDAPCDITQTSTWRKYLLPWKTSSDYRTVYSYDGLGNVEFEREGSRIVKKINYTGNPEF